MYQYGYTIYLFYSDEEPADEDDDDDDPDWQGDGDLGEGSGETGRPPTKRRADSLGGTSGNRGRGGRARGGRGGRARGGGTANTSSKSYNDADTKNDLPPFQPNRPPGIHFGRQVLREV